MENCYIMYYISCTRSTRRTFHRNETASNVRFFNPQNTFVAVVKRGTGTLLRTARAVVLLQLRHLHVAHLRLHSRGHAAHFTHTNGSVGSQDAESRPHGSETRAPPNLRYETQTHTGILNAPRGITNLEMDGNRMTVNVVVCSGEPWARRGRTFVASTLWRLIVRAVCLWSFVALPST